MRYELTMQVRGAERVIRWADGTLTGDDEVLRRLQKLVDDGRVDVTDLLSVVRGTEQVTAQHVSIANLDIVEPDGEPGVATPEFAKAAAVVRDVGMVPIAAA